MRRSKNFTKKANNFDLLLEDIRTTLAENYVFYQECIVAITRAAARHEDASAWFEQMQKLVEGVEGLDISHSGVLFLLREIVRGECDLFLTAFTIVAQCPLTFCSAAGQSYASSTV
jgi:hypothetical protein